MKILSYMAGLSPAKRRAFLICALFTLLPALRYVYIKLRRRLRREVPGPVGLPLLGSLLSRHLSMKREGFFFVDLAETYGPVCQVQLGPMKSVYVLNHSKLATLILRDKKLTFRSKSQKNRSHHLMSTHNQSFVALNGEEWRERRQLAMSLLTNIPSNVLKHIISSALKTHFFPILEQKCVSRARDDSGLEWHMHEELEYLAFNTLYHFNVGRTLDIKDPFFARYATLLHGLGGVQMKSLALKYLPWLRFVTSWEKDVSQARAEQTELTEEIINRRKRVLEGSDENEEALESEDLLRDCNYIDRMLEFEKDGKIARNGIVADISFLFFAGTHTSSITMQAGLLLLAKDVQVQQRVRAALINLWQNNRSPLIEGSDYKEFDLRWLLPSDAMSDSLRSSRNVFIALVNEISRNASIANIGGPHVNVEEPFELEVKSEYGTKDGKDHTYIVPSGTTFFYNVEYIHKHSQSERDWKHCVYGPKKLRHLNDQICLENWICDDDDTKMAQAADMPYLPFGEGPRNCAGKKLAENELQLIMAMLLLNFKFSMNAKKYGAWDAKDVKIKYQRTTTTRIDANMSVRVDRVYVSD